MRTKLSQSWKRLALSSAVVAMTSTSAFAETQGTTGFTSTGDLEITMNVNDEVRISDIDLGDFSGGDLTGTSPACVYRNGAATGYDITATGSGTGGVFELTDPGNTDSVAYSVQFTDVPNNTTVLLNSGTPSTQTNALPAEDCGGNDNGLIRVTVAAADAAALPVAAYSGTLTLLVAPQ